LPPELGVERQGTSDVADLAIARELGPNVDRLTQAVEKHVHAARVANDMKAPKAAACPETPTFS
jgi:hypothetical protein